VPTKIPVAGAPGVVPGVAGDTRAGADCGAVYGVMGFRIGGGITAAGGGICAAAEVIDSNTTASAINSVRFVCTQISAVYHPLAVG